jgi:hypothetical protein
MLSSNHCAMEPENHFLAHTLDADVFTKRR